MGRQHETVVSLSGTLFVPRDLVRSLGSFKELLRTSFETFPQPGAVSTMMIETSNSNQTSVIELLQQLVEARSWKYLVCLVLFIVFVRLFFPGNTRGDCGGLLAVQGRGHQIIWIRASRRSVERDKRCNSSHTTSRYALPSSPAEVTRRKTVRSNQPSCAQRSQKDTHWGCVCQSLSWQSFHPWLFCC